MAHAARLNARMQKELKLLLADPPPGASFPTLCHEYSFSSLTSIDALFQGPQGTVYANGVFKIRIQIPERYPFQPPLVTFATPIYHPNIDNGGRICLDILNLPPKGTWQPSLNISTVLTSIGLLLSEPNPDDGLMHEASREYKYNRQAFDQIARSMTEKYARVGESESSGGSHGSQTHTGPSTAQSETEGSDASPCTECFVYHERFKGSSSKLSLESRQSSSNSNIEKEIYRVPGGLKEANSGSAKYNENPGKSLATKNKMSLAVSRSKNDICLPSQCSSMLDTKTTSNDTPESLPLVEVGNKVSNMDEDYIERSSNISVCLEQRSLQCGKIGQSRDPDEKLQSVPQNKDLSWSLCTSHNKTNPPKKDAIGRKGSCSTSVGLKKVGLVWEIPYLGPLGCPQSHFEDEKEHLTQVQLTDQSAANGMYSNERTGKHVAAIGTLKLSEAAVKLPLKPVDQLVGSDKNVISHSENPSSPLSKFLHVKNDVRSNEKQKINQVHDGESTDKFKQLTEEGSQIPEGVIVLDSEDENVPVRSKLSLPRRCLSRKRKGNLASYR